MEEQGTCWAIVLAAGEGRRLQSMTRDEHGEAVPKQFCSFLGDQSLLTSTLRRARGLVPAESIVTVVAREHRKWWERDLANAPAENVIVQPHNRGTAPGVLLPLLHILLRDPSATVIVLPSDHFVGNEGVLQQAFQWAIGEAWAGRRRPVLLGISPDAPEPGYGWILPAAGDRGPVRGVACFVEKPETSVAARLMRQGAVWNSFMFAASGQSLLRLYRRSVPHLLKAFLSTAGKAGWDAAALDRIYEKLPPRDFSRDVLEAAPDRLGVLSVPSCGWTDLGTPERVMECVGRLGPAARQAGGRSFLRDRAVALEARG